MPLTPSQIVLAVCLAPFSLRPSVSDQTMHQKVLQMSKVLNLLTTEYLLQKPIVSNQPYSLGLWVHMNGEVLFSAQCRFTAFLQRIFNCNEMQNNSLSPTKY